MDPLYLQWGELESRLADPDWDGAELSPMLRDLASASAGASPDERAEVMQKIAAFARGAGIQRGAFAALCGGTLAELGAPLQPLFSVLHERVPRIMAGAGRMVERVHAAFPDPDELEAQGDAAPSGLELGGRMLPLGFVREVAAADLDAVQSLQVLTQWCLPLIATATRDRSLRAGLAADRPFAALAATVAPDHGTARYVYDLLQAPLDEPLRFVERATGRVFDLVMDGVAVNFELHTLLSAALASALGHPPPPPEVLACLGSSMAQECSTPSRGTWDLYGWQALGVTGPIPPERWVWNEGRPADIDAVDGLRVVVGGPPTIQRTWNTCRTFGALVPRVTLIRELAESEAAAFRLTAPAAGAR